MPLLYLFLCFILVPLLLVTALKVFLPLLLVGLGLYAFGLPDLKGWHPEALKGLTKRPLRALMALQSQVLALGLAEGYDLQAGAVTEGGFVVAGLEKGEAAELTKKAIARLRQGARLAGPLAPTARIFATLVLFALMLLALVASRKVGLNTVLIALLAARGLSEGVGGELGYQLVKADLPYLVFRSVKESDEGLFVAVDLEVKAR